MTIPFPHNLEPTPENLKRHSEFMKSKCRSQLAQDIIDSKKSWWKEVYLKMTKEQQEEFVKDWADANHELEYPQDVVETPGFPVKHTIEGLFDWICSEIGFGKETQELRDGIKLFGRMRAEEAKQERTKEIVKIATGLEKNEFLNKGTNKEIYRYKRGYNQAIKDVRDNIEKDHKCGGDLCIVCGYREKLKESN